MTSTRVDLQRGAANKQLSHYETHWHQHGLGAGKLGFSNAALVVNAKENGEFGRAGDIFRIAMATVVQLESNLEFF